MNFVEIETKYKFCRNFHICRKSFLEIMKLTNKWLMELFLQMDDPNYFSCFKFMCHNHHNQLCLMILRHKSTSLGYLFMSQWREIISEILMKLFLVCLWCRETLQEIFQTFRFTLWLNTTANLAQRFFCIISLCPKKAFGGL